MVPRVSTSGVQAAGSGLGAKAAVSSRDSSGGGIWGFFPVTLKPSDPLAGFSGNSPTS